MDSLPCMWWEYKDESMGRYRVYHQPLFCPKYKREHLVNVKQFKTQIANEPDAKTQS